MNLCLASGFFLKNSFFPPHQVVFRVYYWLCTQGLFLAVLGGSYRILKSATSKTIALPVVLWPQLSSGIFVSSTGISCPSG